MSEPRAVVTGEMAGTGLGELLYSLYERKVTGSLVVAESEQTLHCVRLVSGLPQKVRLAEPHDPLATLLVEQGALEAEHVRQVLEVSTSGGTLFGLTAVHMGLVTADELRSALVLQVIRRTARLFAVTTGTYGFYNEDFLSSYGGQDAPPVDPLAVISSGVRTLDRGRLDRALATVSSRPLSVARGSKLVGRFRFDREEATVVSAMGEARGLDELEALPGAGPLAARRVAYCLLVVGALETGAAAAPAARPSVPPAQVLRPQAPRQSAPPPQAPRQSAPPPQAPRQSAPPPQAPRQSAPPGAAEPEDRRAAAEALIAGFRQMNYFEILGVEPGASDSEMQQAYVARARSFHPDRARGELADLKAGLAEFFAQVTVARQTLMDPAAREKYVKKQGLSPAPRRPSPPPPTPRPEPAPSRAPAAAAASSERRLAAEDLLATYRTMDHFALLGLEPGATDAEVQKAYASRVRSYHPDRATGELADLQPQIAELFGRITQAHKVLKDPRSRGEYEASLRGASAEADEEQAVRAILDAETTFQKARVLLKTNRLDEAERLAREAARADPDQGQYAALVAWIEARRRGPKDDVTDLVDRLRLAAKLAPRSEEVHFYLAELLNRSGRHREAFKAYEATVELNQHNIDAVRMVRLLRKNLETEKKKEKQKGGLMGFLMKDVGKK